MLKLLMTILLLISSGAIADSDSIGIVIASKGVNVTSEGRTLSQGSFVYQSETILTSSKTFVVVQFTDGTKITVRPDSELVLDAYSYEGTSSDEMQVSLLSGGLRVVTGAMAKTNPDNYKLNTPVALMGVRGTEFSILLCGDNTCTE